MFPRLGLFAVLLSTTPACGLFQQLEVEPLATGFQRPSNVAAYVAVSDADEPLTELEPSNFQVYENEQLVPSEQTRLTLLDREQAAAHHALLLLDMSQANSAEARTAAAKGALGFVEKLSPLEAVSVYAFDGSPTLVLIANVGKGGSPPSLAALERFTPRDSSRNLNGAVVAALDKLDAALAPSGKAVKRGTLVVFASGPDVAGRVEADKVHDAIWNSPHDVIAVGVGEQADALEPLARRGLVRAQSTGALPIALDEAAQKARSELQKYYLVSYCSPARAGSRRLRLEVKYTTKDGDEHHGDFETDFDARGFGPGCNPQNAPRLTLVPQEPREPPPSKQPTGDGTSGTAPSPAEPPDAHEHEQGEDAPVPPPDASGYAK